MPIGAQAPGRPYLRSVPIFLPSQGLPQVTLPTPPCSPSAQAPQRFRRTCLPHGRCLPPPTPGDVLVAGEERLGVQGKEWRWLPTGSFVLTCA